MLEKLNIGVTAACFVMMYSNPNSHIHMYMHICNDYFVGKNVTFSR